MTKHDMIQTLAQAIGVPQPQARAGLDKLLDEMATELQAGGEVPLPGIGTLRRAVVKGGEGRNPRTMEKIEIAPGYKVKFVQSAPMKRRLADLAERRPPRLAAE